MKTDLLSHPAKVHFLYPNPQHSSNPTKNKRGNIKIEARKTYITKFKKKDN